MLDLGTLAAKLTVDDSGLRSGLKDAEKQATQTGKNIGDGVERGASPGLGKIGGLIAGLGLVKLGGDAISFGLQTAMGMEQATIAFTTLLGNGQKAQDFMTKLKAFAATTPFEFPELQDSASKLLATGIEANKVIPIMTTLGNVTSGMGTGAEGIDRAVIALQQMNAAGKITGEDLNQLRDAGIPVYDLLAAATGRSKAEVTALAQAGKLGAKDLAAMMEALETGKGLERFNGLMDAQSQSLAGIISTLSDTVGQGLAAAMEPLIPFIKQGIGALTEALPGALNMVVAFFQALITGGLWVAENQGWLTGLAITIGVLAAAYGTLAAAQAAAAAGSFTTWILQVTHLTKAWSAVQAAFNLVMSANPIALVIIAIAALVAGLIYAYNNSKQFRDIVDAAFRAIGEAGRWLWNNALAPALRAIVGGFGWVAEGAGNMLDALAQIPGFEWAKQGADFLHSVADGADGAVKALGDIPPSQEAAADATQDNADANTNLATTAKDATEQSKWQTEAAKKHQAAVDKETAALKDWLTAQQKALGLVLDAREANRNYEAALDAASEAVKKNGKTLDAHTEKGRANQEALDAIAKTGLDEVESLRQQGKGNDTLRGKMQSVRDSFVENARKMGLNRTEAEKLADKFKLIPRKIPVTVDVTTQFRKNHAQITVGGVGVTTVRIAANARGGPVTNGLWSLVGEEGPELVRFGASGRVYPADKTRQMLAGGAGTSSAPAPVTVSVTFIDDALGAGQQLYDVLRKLNQSTGYRGLSFT